MENLKFKNKIGRPSIYSRLDENFLKSEIKKYIEGKQILCYTKKLEVIYMIEIQEKNIGKYLKKFKNLGVYITFEGNLRGKFVIHKLKYTILFDMLRLEDLISTTYLEINLNQSSKTQVSIDFKKIMLHLDEDIDMVITIEN